MNAESLASLIANVVVVILVVALIGGTLSQSVRVVREYQRLVVFRLGKCIGERGPGPNSSSDSASAVCRRNIRSPKRWWNCSANAGRAPSRT